jgi:hypothetical protein
MTYHDPLRQILARTRPHWDRNTTRPTVRWAFAATMKCRKWSWAPRFSLRRTMSSSSATPANRGPARVAAIVLPYSGFASAGPHCQTYSIRGSRSRCRTYFGPFSGTIRAWLRLCRLSLQRPYRAGWLRDMVCGLASLPFSTLSTGNWSSIPTSTQWSLGEGCAGPPTPGLLASTTIGTH